MHIAIVNTAGCERSYEPPRFSPCHAGPAATSVSSPTFSDLMKSEPVTLGG